MPPHQRKAKAGSHQSAAACCYDFWWWDSPGMNAVKTGAAENCYLQRDCDVFAARSYYQGLG